MSVSKISSILMSTLTSGSMDIPGNGKIARQSREIQVFQQINVSIATTRVVIRKGTSTQLEVVADKNILPYIKTRVKNGCLIVGVLRNINLKPTQSIEIHITTPTVNILRNSGSSQLLLPFTTVVEVLQVFNSGSGNMDLLLEADLLEVCNSGSGQVTLAGDVVKLSCSSSGSGHVRAGNCSVKEVYFNASGSGQSHFSCGEKLVGFISGSGGVYYNGNPSFVRVDSQGSGKLSKN